MCGLSYYPLPILLMMYALENVINENEWEMLMFALSSAVPLWLGFLGSGQWGRGRAKAISTKKKCGRRFFHCIGRNNCRIQKRSRSRARADADRFIDFFLTHDLAVVAPALRHCTYKAVAKNTCRWCLRCGRPIWSTLGFSSRRPARSLSFCRAVNCITGQASCPLSLTGGNRNVLCSQSRVSSVIRWAQRRSSR